MGRLIRQSDFIGFMTVATVAGPISHTRETALLLALRMIFPENRFPLFGIIRYSTANSCSIAAIRRGSLGSPAGVKAAFRRPSRPIRYLWKFQRGASSGRSCAAHL